MAVIDGRRAPFCWLSIAALELIADNVAEGKLEGIRNTYLGLAQVAARARDGQHDGFEATVQEIAAAACVHRATIKRHLPELERLGLLEVRARTAPNGARMPSAYVLLEPTTEVRDTRRPTDNGTPAEPPAHHAPPPGAPCATGGARTAI